MAARREQDSLDPVATRGPARIVNKCDGQPLQANASGRPLNSVLCMASNWLGQTDLQVVTVALKWLVARCNFRRSS